MKTHTDKILVVEDERLVAEDIAECLRSVGYDVIGTAKSCAEAVVQVEEGRPDLVLMDITLRGDVDGIDTAHILKDRFATPVVFLTAYSQKTILDRAKEVEPLGYVVKPFDEGSLVSTVEMALHKARVDAALRKSEEWFSTTLRSIGDGVIATDEHGNVRFLNKVAEELTGWGAKEAEARHIREVFVVRSSKDDSEISIPALEAMQTGHVVELVKHAVLVRRDGSRIDVNTTRVRRFMTTRGNWPVRCSFFVTSPKRSCRKRKWSATVNNSSPWSRSAPQSCTGRSKWRA